MSYAYATTNKLNGLAATAFTWSAGLNDATRAYLNDGWMDVRYVNGNHGGGTLGVVIDFGAATTMTGWAVLNHNVAVQSPGSTLDIVGADDAAISVNPVTAKQATTLNSATGYNKDHVFQHASLSKRYWRLRFNCPTPVTALAIGELYAFNTQTVLSRKSIYGDGEMPEIKTSKVDFSSGGSNAYFLGGPIRSKRLVFTELTTAERDELLLMWTVTRGPTTPFLWIEAYEATGIAAPNIYQEVIYGRLMLDVFDWRQPDYLLYEVPELKVVSLSREIGS